MGPGRPAPERRAAAAGVRRPILPESLPSPSRMAACSEIFLAKESARRGPSTRAITFRIHSPQGRARCRSGRPGLEVMALRMAAAYPKALIPSTHAAIAILWKSAVPQVALDFPETGTAGPMTPSASAVMPLPILGSFLMARMTRGGVSPGLAMAGAPGSWPIRKKQLTLAFKCRRCPFCWCVCPIVCRDLMGVCTPDP